VACALEFRPAELRPHEKVVPPPADASGARARSEISAPPTAQSVVELFGAVRRITLANVFSLVTLQVRGRSACTRTDGVVEE